MAETRTHNLFNEITGINGDATAVSHDAAGNMTQFPGALTGSQPMVATWDAWNRLIGLSTTSGTAVAAYAYDGDWKRTKKTVGSAVSEYYYDDMQLAETRTNGVASEQFVYDSRYLHSVALRDRDTDGDGDCADATGSERLFYCNDANFNATALVATNGAVVERYTYDPYGKVTIRDVTWQPVTWDASRKNVCLYTGHKFDAESGLYYSIYRYYHPGLGRWASRDPLFEVRKILTVRGVSGWNLVEERRKSNNYRRHLRELENWLNSVEMEEWYGLTVYKTVRNAPTRMIDSIGLLSLVFSGPVLANSSMSINASTGPDWMPVC